MKLLIIYIIDFVRISLTSDYLNIFKYNIVTMNVVYWWLTWFYKLLNLHIIIWK